MEQLLVSLCIGAILGLAGQGIRSVVGLKKTYDQPGVTTKNFAEKFERQRFLISLFIGAIAGILASLTLDLASSAALPSKETISGIIAAGYSGADFIEGFMRKKLP